MANIQVPANPGFPDVYQWELNDDVIGGPGGIATRPIQELTERTAYLRKKTDETLQNDINAINTRIDHVESMGDYAGAFNTYALLPKNISGFPKGITVNDFVTIRADETRNGATVRYVVTAIASNGSITWTYDVTYTTDITQKADKASPTFTGTPQVPSKTAAATNNGTLIATEAQVKAVADSIPAKVQENQYYLGYIYTQLPGGYTPAELVTKGVFPSGTWADWTAKAEIYELIPTASYPASTPATYASGQTIAVNDLRIYQLTGDDRQIWKAKNAIASTPSQMNPKDWDLLLSSSIVRVRRCDLQTSWTAADHAIGATVTYNNTSYRVVGILVLGGKYLAGAGGNRGTFNGGTVPDAIRNIVGRQNAAGAGVFNLTDFYGPFYTETDIGNYAAGMSGQGAGVMYFNTDRIVPTGNENQVRAMAVRYWRKVS